MRDVGDARAVAEESEKGNVIKKQYDCIAELFFKCWEKSFRMWLINCWLNVYTTFG